MPLLNAPGQAGLQPDSSPTRADRALADVRAALALIAADPQARRLLADADADHPDPDGPLADWLYRRWWCGPGVGPGEPTPIGPGSAGRGAARLEAARRTGAPISAGWLVLAAAGDVLVAASLGDRGGPGSGAPTARIRSAPDAVVESSRPGRPPRPGDLVTLQRGSSGLDPSKAWWWAHAGRPEDLAGVALDRWYVHVRDLGTACAVVPLLLDVAAEVGCPLSLKCPPVEHGYGRRDALVAYLPRSDGSRAEGALRRRSGRLRALLVPEVPPCTRQLVPGVGQAQDPGAGSTEAAVSYGQLRCAQVATLAARLSAAPVSDRALAAALLDLGVDVDAIEEVQP
ncbi:MAG TPA: T3SS effector HopA1 family protein [Microlunatus sp.]|nr:T3SS effector HopA1 family protein [Microlunatus sp.]